MFAGKKVKTSANANKSGLNPLRLGASGEDFLFWCAKRNEANARARLCDPRYRSIRFRTLGIEADRRRQRSADLQPAFRVLHESRTGFREHTGRRAKEKDRQLCLRARLCQWEQEVGTGRAHDAGRIAPGQLRDRLSVCRHESCAAIGLLKGCTAAQLYKMIEIEGKNREASTGLCCANNGVNRSALIGEIDRPSINGGYRRLRLKTHYTRIH